jgi:hypothetical protein
LILNVGSSSDFFDDPLLFISPDSSFDTGFGLFYDDLIPLSLSYSQDEPCSEFQGFIEYDNPVTDGALSTLFPILQGSPQDNLIQDPTEVSSNPTTELPQSIEASTTSSTIKFANTFPEPLTSNTSTISLSDSSESALLGGGDVQPTKQSRPFRCLQCEKVFPKQSNLKYELLLRFVFAYTNCYKPPFQDAQPTVPL